MGDAKAHLLAIGPYIDRPVLSCHEDMKSVLTAGEVTCHIKTFCLLFIDLHGPSFGADSWFRYKEGKCLNSAGQKGLNQ